MGMPAALGVRATIDRPLIFPAGIMQMVRNGLDVVVNKWIEMLSRLALVTATLNDVKQMRDDASLDDALAALIEINTPRIARSFPKDFEFAFGRMIPPDGSVDAGSVFVR